MKKIIKVLSIACFLFLLVGCEQEEELYNVTFLDYQDQVVYETTVKRLDEVIYPFEEPTKPNEGKTGYRFIGWDNLTDLVLSDLIVRPVFESYHIMTPIEEIEISFNDTIFYAYGYYEYQISHYPFDADVPLDLTYTSSNPNVADFSVFTNRIDTFQPGTTTLTIYCKNNDISVLIEIEVIPQPVYVDFIEILSENSKNLTVGQSHLISYKLWPEHSDNKVVSFSSTNEDILTVDEFGIVRPLKAGQASVLLEIDYTYTYVDFYVYNKVSILTLSESSLSLEVGDYYSVYAYQGPDNIIELPVSWSSSNSNIASVDGDGLIIAHQAGSATITARLSNNLKASILVTVKSSTVTNPQLVFIDIYGMPVDLTDAMITGVTYSIVNQTNDASVRFYVSGYVTRAVQGMAFYVEITDMYGKVTKLRHLDYFTIRQANQTFSIQLHIYLEPGYYQVTVIPYSLHY